MAAFDTTRTAYGASGPFGRAGAPFASLRADLSAWNDARKTRKALSALSDRALEDIGLPRCDIERIATTRRRV